ncbi:LysR family transcriptional regulator [Rhizobium sp. No.120]
MSLDTLTSMSVFRQMVERGSITAAAQFCGMSAEMAGHHLRSLEARLGVRLINRTTRRLHVTEAGQAYYRRCVAVLEEVALADAEAGQRQSSPSGMLKIAAPLAFGTALLSEPIAVFIEENPSVSVELSLSERNVSLIEEGYDVALRLGDLQESGLIARRLSAFPLIPVASEAYLAQHSPISAPWDIADHQVLIYTQTANPRSWRFNDAAGHHVDVSLTGRIAASDVEFLLRLALRGAGLLLAPSFVVADYLVRKELVAILPEWSMRTLPLSLVLPHRTLIPATVRSLSDFLSSWFR